MSDTQIIQLFKGLANIGSLYVFLGKTCLFMTVNDDTGVLVFNYVYHVYWSLMLDLFIYDPYYVISAFKLLFDDKM